MQRKTHFLSNFRSHGQLLITARCWCAVDRKSTGDAPLLSCWKFPSLKAHTKSAQTQQRKHEQRELLHCSAVWIGSNRLAGYFVLLPNDLLLKLLARSMCPQQQALHPGKGWNHLCSQSSHKIRCSIFSGLHLFIHSLQSVAYSPRAVGGRAVYVLKT